MVAIVPWIDWNTTSWPPPLLLSRVFLPTIANMIWYTSIEPVYLVEKRESSQPNDLDRRLDADISRNGQVGQVRANSEE